MSHALKVKEWFSSRDEKRAAFAARSGWEGASEEVLNNDSANRHYYRLTKDKTTVVLMDSVPDGHELATPGHSMKSFARISDVLRGAELRVPYIYAVDFNEGFMLLEDFGDTTFKAAIAEEVPEETLYSSATDALFEIERRVSAEGLDLPSYYESHVHKGRQRIVDWYVPAVKRRKNPDGLVESYLKVWDEIEAELPACPQGFVYVDYHFENIMWLDGADDADSAGLLDFQGAMVGPQPYDLANLLEDPRFEIDQDLRNALKGRFCWFMEKEDRELFDVWYRVLATQFHCRVMGQFIRLALRDEKMIYMEYLPRVAQYLQDGLKHPVLAPLAKWFDEQSIDFSVTSFDIDYISAFIRDDAF